MYKGGLVAFLYLRGCRHIPMFDDVRGSGNVISIKFFTVNAISDYLFH